MCVQVSWRVISNSIECHCGWIYANLLLCPEDMDGQMFQGSKLRVNFAQAGVSPTLQLALELKLVHQPFSGCQYQDSVAGFVSKR